MKTTISLQCSSCGYVRYDLIHLSKGCGGVLIYDSYLESVRCHLCSQDMSDNVSVYCPSCGTVRVLNLSSLGAYQRVGSGRMQVFTTIVIRCR